MKKLMIAASAALICAATPAQAADDLLRDVTYGAGIGSVDLGGVGTGTLFYGIAEKELRIDQLRDVDTSAQLRVGTSTKASAGLVEFGIDYLISGMFKASKEVQKGISAYGMLGFSYASITASATVPFLGTVSASSTDTSFGYGIGADYEVNRDLTVGLEYAAYWSDVTAIAVNAKFNF